MICAGGGGIPTTCEAGRERALGGIEAVIDKDLASELLAREIDADLFVMATDVDGVYEGWGTPEQRKLTEVSPEELKAGTSPPVPWDRRSTAAVQFVERTGRRAAIGSLARHREDRRGHRRHERRPGATHPSGRGPGMRGASMSEVGVHSEVGKLRKVMVHRPDLSLQRLTPTNHDELLFDDVLWVERAQQEHDQFVSEMRSRDVEVFLLVRPAGGDAGQQRRGPDATHRGRGVRVHGRLVARRRGARAARRALGAGLATHLIGGLTVEEAGLDLGAASKVSLIGAAIDDPSQFVLPPLPNTLFTRDSSCWIYGGVSVNPMYWPARRREAYNVAAIYRAHPMFVEADFEFWYPHLGDDDRLETAGLRSGLDGGRRRHADRERCRVDRHERAHAGSHDRAGRRMPSSPRAPPTGSSPA